MLELAFEINHEWVQRLPLRDSTLVCVNCRQGRHVDDAPGNLLSCAEVLAWCTYGATTDGRFVYIQLKKTR